MDNDKPGDMWMKYVSIPPKIWYHGTSEVRSTYPTRGQVRDLCRAYGVTLKEGINHE